MGVNLNSCGLESGHAHDRQGRMNMKDAPMRPKQSTKVVPIRRDILAADEVRKVADLAYNFWLANGFWGRSPEEALFTAMRQLKRNTAAGLFLVPRRNTARSNLYPLSRDGT
jgi:hypothetical protein